MKLKYTLLILFFCIGKMPIYSQTSSKNVLPSMISDDVMFMQDSIPLYSDEVLDENSHLFMYKITRYTDDSMVLFLCERQNMDRLDSLCMSKPRLNPSYKIKSEAVFCYQDTITREIEKQYAQQFLSVLGAHTVSRLYGQSLSKDKDSVVFVMQFFIEQNGRVHKLAIRLNKKYFKCCTRIGLYNAYNCLNHNMYYYNAKNYKIDGQLAHFFTIDRADLRLWLRERGIGVKSMIEVLSE